MSAPAAELEFRLEPLGQHHNREAFTCGIESLDRYLKTQAAQDMRRKANAVFVLVRPGEPERIIGYFTLCASALDMGVVPETARKHLPRYPLVSATLIGRLAIGRNDQGQGLGSMLLGHAVQTAYENAVIVGSSMIVVDTIDERAARFYVAHGFIRLPDSLRLILPMKSIGAAMAK